MPELPEVETIARALRQGGRGGETILDRKVCEAHLLWERTLAVPDRQTFTGRLPGQSVLGVGRRGKFLIIQLSQDHLLVHLRMSGDLRVELSCEIDGETRPFLPHDRLVVDFEDGYRLAFNDTRKFGRAWLMPDPSPVLALLGPEPLDPAFTADQFYHRLHGHHRQTKPLLLDQHFIAGLGNIYTDEALHLANIHPLRPADTLTPEEAWQLWSSIRGVLNEGIRRNGASIDWAYRGGDFQNTFQVYQRTGEPCSRCGTPIERTTVGQRGTHFCPTCQPEFTR